MCLEALLSGNAPAVTQRITMCAALLAGRNENERNWIASFMTKAYGVRSDLVHGRAPSKDIDLVKLRPPPEF